MEAAGLDVSSTADPSKATAISLAPKSEASGNKAAPAASENPSTIVGSEYYLKIHQSWIVWFKDVGSAVGLIILLHLLINAVVQNT